MNNRAYMIALAAIVMAYGWGYRGDVGHEGGAMIPGAMLGLAVCLASNRADWQRRAAVVGLFAAAGYSWGGSLSYMEHTMFAVSDSLPDVAYGYSMLFFLGALWAGIAGTIIGLAFTSPRSELQRLTRVFAVLCTAYLAVYLFFLFTPDVKARYEQFTVDHFHDGEWLPASIALIVCAAHALLVPKDRKAALLFVSCAAAWWVFYLALTKFGGLTLAPPFRSEAWGGVVGILVVLIVYLVRTNNRAAMLLCRYGLLGGGLGFMFAVFVRHPVRVAWGPLAPWAAQLPQWKIAEESFGLFMGIAFALAVLRLERSGLAPAIEDTPRKPLDIFAVFVLLVALMWVNLRRAPMDWLDRYKAVPNDPVFGIMPWAWYTAGAMVVTAVALYALYLYGKNRLAIAPPTPYGRAALILILMLWLTAIGSFVQTFPSQRESRGDFLTDGSFIVLCAIATILLLRAPRVSASIDSTATVAPNDPRWNPGLPYAALWLATPIFIAIVTTLSMAMQDGPVEGARLRFGPNAYWRAQSAMIGTWHAIGYAQSPTAVVFTDEPLDIATIDFTPSRNVSITLTNGARADLHKWHYMNSLTHLDWNARTEDPKDDATVPITLRDNRMYVPRPPDEPGATYLVLEK